MAWMRTFSSFKTRPSGTSMRIQNQCFKQALPLKFSSYAHSERLFEFSVLHSWNSPEGFKECKFLPTGSVSVLFSPCCVSQTSGIYITYTCTSEMLGNWLFLNWFSYTYTLKVFEVECNSKNSHGSMQGLWNTPRKTKNRDTENWGQTTVSERGKFPRRASQKVVPLGRWPSGTLEPWHDIIVVCFDTNANSELYAMFEKKQTRHLFLHPQKSASWRLQTFWQNHCFASYFLQPRSSENVCRTMFCTVCVFPQENSHYYASFTSILSVCNVWYANPGLEKTIPSGVLSCFFPRYTFAFWRAPTGRFYERSFNLVII